MRESSYHVATSRQATSQHLASYHTSARHVTTHPVSLETSHLTSQPITKAQKGSETLRLETDQPKHCQTVFNQFGCKSVVFNFKNACRVALPGRPQQKRWRKRRREALQLPSTCAPERERERERKSGSKGNKYRVTRTDDDEGLDECTSECILVNFPKLMYVSWCRRARGPSVSPARTLSPVAIDR